jgi:hypothetical protein
MSTRREHIRTALQADAREHGVRLTLKGTTAPADNAVFHAVHTALHGLALAQVDANEITVTLAPRRDHEVEVEAHLKG